MEKIARLAFMFTGCLTLGFGVSAVLTPPVSHAEIYTIGVLLVAVIATGFLRLKYTSVNE